MVIRYYYVHALEFPGREEWMGKYSTIQHILTLFNITNNEKRNMVRMLTYVQLCMAHNITYRSKKCNIQNQLGRPIIIDTGLVEELLIANWMEQGNYFRKTTYIVNNHQKYKGLIHVGVLAVRNDFQRIHQKEYGKFSLLKKIDPNKLPKIDNHQLV